MIIRIINGSVNILYGKSASSYEDTDSTHVELSTVCMASEQKKGLLLSEITVACGEKKRANQTRTCLDLDTVSTVHLCCHGKQTFPV